MLIRPRLLAVPALVLALTMSACGGGDDTTDAAATTAAATTAATTVPATTGSVDQSTTTRPAPTTTRAAAPATTAAPTTAAGDAGESALGGNPEGMVTVTIGERSFDAEVTECTLVDPDIALVAEGETAEVEVTSRDGGTVAVSVTGVVQFEGEGVASFDQDTAGIDRGEVVIVGTGSQPDDAAATEDFTILVSIQSC